MNNVNKRAINWESPNINWYLHLLTNDSMFQGRMKPNLMDEYYTMQNVVDLDNTRSVCYKVTLTKLHLIYFYYHLQPITPNRSIQFTTLLLSTNKNRKEFATILLSTNRNRKELPFKDLRRTFLCRLYSRIPLPGRPNRLNLQTENETVIV